MLKYKLNLELLIQLASWPVESIGRDLECPKSVYYSVFYEIFVLCFWLTGYIVSITKSNFARQLK